VASHALAFFVAIGIATSLQSQVGVSPLPTLQDPLELGNQVRMVTSKVMLLARIAL
jgi:hypothetical protein